jgi:antirestriction protein ArdC
VRKGATGELVVYANRLTCSETNDKGEQQLREIPFLKGCPVINAEQCEGLPAHYSTPGRSPKRAPGSSISMISEAGAGGLVTS